LADERNSPLVVAVNEIAAVCNKGSGDGTTEPATIIKTYFASAMELYVVG
jgi:hypothetical protein